MSAPSTTRDLHRVGNVRLRRGLTVVPTERGLVVEGVGRRHLFGGASATDVLPRLFTLLDGDRDLAGIAGELGLDAAQLTSVLDLLTDRGLLEPVPSGVVTAEETVADYLSRTGPVAAADGGSGNALVRLAMSRVVLTGPAVVTGRIADDLRVCGVGEITTVAQGDPVPVGPANLLVVCDDGTGRVGEAYGAGAADRVGDADRVGEAYRIGVAEGCEVLRCSVRRTAGRIAAIEIGPRFHPGHTACPDCLRTGHERAFPEEELPEEELPEGSTPSGDASGELPGAVAGLFAGLVAAQITAVLAGTAHPVPRRDLWRLTLPDHTSRRWTVAPEPGCRACGPIGTGAEQELDTVEWLLQSPPDEVFQGDSAAPDWPDPLDVLDLTTSPRRRLAAPDSTACTPGLLDEQAVSLLLSRTAGPRETTGAPGSLPSRWCPSGGNRGSVQLFLLTDESWPGLPGTAFKYDADAGTLIAVRADKPSVSELLGGTGLAGRQPRAAVVVTGAVYRLRGKYGDFAFRLAHLDAGCALAQCALVAAELGLEAELVSGDTGGLAGQLDLNPGDQLAMGIIGLYGKDTGDAAAGPA
ncbi:TOMM precursor leader peptide-binding protein [Streptomyces sp. NPDC090052]|uniref:TOMM precursor leader peptide-binding protein n=1 Tax=Streptomyces sp. NPDC090052 TaxID=3365931 RepID=UPI00380AD6DE